MIRQNKTKIKLKILIFLGICSAMIAFSLSWYHALVGMDCTMTNPEHPSLVKMSSLVSGMHDCNEQLNFHWVKFLGINGLIYGASVFAFVANMRKKPRN